MDEIDSLILTQSLKRANTLAWESIRKLVKTDNEADEICKTKVYLSGLEVSYRGSLIQYTNQ